MNQVYALVVGINEYPDEKARLHGCVGDARAWEETLRERTGGGDRLHLQVLTDGKATRERIIDSFRSHLGQAGAGDTVVFAFSGHGSQEQAPAAWAHSEAGGLSETLLAVDSRIDPGGLDLADKELAALIAELSEKTGDEGHILVVVDSCHSGTVTRDYERVDVDWVTAGPARLVEPRPASADRHVSKAWSRPRRSYWFEHLEEPPVEIASLGGLKQIPWGRHVLFAACEDRERARECVLKRSTGDVHRGAFTYYLLETLRQLGDGATYGDLLEGVKKRLKADGFEQLPKAEGDLQQTFLSGQSVPRTTRYRARFSERLDRWALDGGAVHGIRQEAGLDLYTLGAVPGEADPVARARVAAVEPGESFLEILGTLPDEGETYGAVVTYSPEGRTAVAVEGSVSINEQIARAIESSADLYLLEEKNEQPADLLIRWQHGGWQMRLADQDDALVAPVDSAALIRGLEHVSRWHGMGRLNSPHDRLGKSLRVEVHQLLPDGADDGATERLLTATDGEVRLAYGAGSSTAPRFTLRFQNDLDTPLYCAAFGLDETFAIHPLTLAPAVLSPGDDLWLYRVDGIEASVPDWLHARGIAERRDRILIVASSVEYDASPIPQGSLAEALAPHRGDGPTVPPEVVGELFSNPGVRYRELGVPRKKEFWFPVYLDLVTTRGPADSEPS